MSFGGPSDPAQQRPGSRQSPPARIPGLFRGERRTIGTARGRRAPAAAPRQPVYPPPQTPAAAPAPAPAQYQPRGRTNRRGRTSRTGSTSRRPDQPQPQAPQYAQAPQYVQPLAYPQNASSSAAPVYGSVLAQRPDHHESAAYDTYTPPAPVAAVAALPVPSAKGRHASVWAFGVLGFVLLGLIAYFVWALGPAASVIGMVLALIPLTIVFFGVFFIDRWEPEPKSLVAFAIAWGAIASIGIALLVDLGLTYLVGRRPEGLSAVLQAPIVEESAKGIGVFLVFLMARRAFDGPIDGIVYGALVGAGFAFTENIQYFAVSLIEGGTRI